MGFSEGTIFGIASMLSAGFSDFLAKGNVGKHGALSALKVSLIFGTLLIAVYSFFFTSFPQISVNAIVFSLLAGTTAALGWLSFYKALKTGKVSVVSPIVSGWGLVTFLLAIVFLSEKLTTMQFALSGMSLAGVFLVSTNIREFIKNSGKLNAGTGMAVLSMIFCGLSDFLSKFIVDEVGAFYTIVFVRAVAIAIILAYSFGKENNARIEAKSAGLLLIVGILDAVGYLAYNMGISVGLVSIVAVICSAAPLLTMVLAHLFMKERLAKSQYLGIALIVAGVAGLSLG